MNLRTETFFLFCFCNSENIVSETNVFKIQCFVEMATIRHCAGRWVGRYRLYFFIGFVILAIQIYLAYKSLTIQPYTDANSVSKEHQRIKKQGDKYRNQNAVIDDEDIQSNSNNINTLSKQKFDILKSHSNVNKTVLHLEELEFTPPCEIQSREAISAIHRAKTQKCKKQIVDITCLIQENKFYPQSLPNYCPNEDLVANRALGCFKDEKNYRLLSGYYANYKSSNTPKYCSQMCLQSGFPYAGVQYSTECFCGVNPPPSTLKQPDSSCNMKCPGNPKEICGGYFKMNVFETGIAKFTAQTALTSSNNESEPHVRIAYLLTLNGRAVRQVYRLIKALFHTDHYFYIHVDSRQDYMFRQLLPLEKRFSNIRLSRKRFSTIWGGASLLQMLLASMGELLKSDWKWDFVINLSESDFPIKTNAKLVQFLTANRDKNFVKSHGREVQRFIQKQGLDKTFIECDTHMWRVGDRTLPWGIQIDGGSDWITLTREFVKYVTQENDELIVGLMKVFKHTLLPAESFFHTVLRNSKFCKTYIDNNLHVTNWKRRLGCKCQYKHVVDWCGCSPNDFKIEDWPRLQATEVRQLFFARKFEPVIDQSIILKLEQLLFSSQTSVENAQSYWQSIYHYADISPSVDDALIAISKSLMRLNSHEPSGGDCKFNLGKILEVTSYHVHDKFKGYIIQYEVNIGTVGVVKMELLMSVKNHTEIISKSHLNKHFSNVYVSSDYDQKEQTSRNFGRIIGPFSDIVAVYEYVPEIEVFHNTNITLIFIDPSGTVADICDGHIDHSRTINFVKPSLKEPHLPGVWTVKLVHSKQLIAVTKFLVTPLETYLGNEINEKHLDFIHRGNNFYKSSYSTSELKSFFLSNTEKESLNNLATANSQKIRGDLLNWIDSLVSSFYSILGQCIIIDKNKIKNLKCSNFNIAHCDQTDWSSIAQDPKSSIGKIDLKTGMFVRP